MNSSTRRRLGSAIAALGVAVATAGLLPAPAQAASVGYVRLAHLSPDTPAVDVYLTAQSGSLKQKFDAVPYGVISEYLSLPVGSYAVAMRQVGAPESSPPVLTTEVVVGQGEAYTVAGVGRFADLGLRVFNDDLAAPEAGKSKLRVIQASVRAAVLDISVANGPTIADDVAFATTTDYVTVQPGRVTLKLTPVGTGPSGEKFASLRNGYVYTLLVLDSGNGRLKAELRTDARRDGAVPFGGIDTGGGGTSRAPATSGTPWLVAASGLVLVGVGMIAVRRLRPYRPRHQQ